MENELTNDFNFDLPKNKSNVIKVIGVGGGGSNAINYMYSQGIKGVDFVVTNTDAQALTESPVPIKIQLGASLTEGLGAGANPEIGALAAQESKGELENLLTTKTKMVFITAGMGGGTGTGAAPIIAKMAKDLDILTVGIVTMPFQFEGKIRLQQAQEGLEKIKQNVDALIVINNNKLRMVYGNLGFKAGFSKADEVLATAARGIAEVITHHYTQNIDLKDAKTVLTNSGTAIMGSGSASGSNRAQEAIAKALDSPLLNDNKITGCKNVLLLIVSGTEEITIDEIGEINDYIQTEAGNHTNIIMGVGEDESLGNAVAVTVIATGFGVEQQMEIANTEVKKIIHTLEDEQKVEHNLMDQEEAFQTPIEKGFEAPLENNSAKEANSMQPHTEDELLHHEIMNMEVVYDIIEAEPVSEKQPLIENEIVQEQDPAFVQNEEIESPVESAANEIEETAEELVFETQEEAEPVEMNLDLTSVEQEFVADEFPSLENEDLTTYLEEEPSADQTEVEEDFSLAFEPSDIEQIEEDLQDSLSQEEEPVEPQEFIFNDVTASELAAIEVHDAEEVLSDEPQITMDFEKPFEEVRTPKKVDEPQLDLEPAATHQLESVEEPSAKVETFDYEEETIAFELKTVDAEEQQPEVSDSIFENATLAEATPENSIEAQADPFDQPIKESFAKNNEIRKEQLKKFNYKFKHQLQQIDELESKPAFERKGLDLSETETPPPSRTSLNDGDDDTLHFRSNNSFLHDNVD
ncbi:MAG: cell division protein FtsZ [Flavobacteriaceae bacterium]|jgi:cell division protein FtsZ